MRFLLVGFLFTLSACSMQNTAHPLQGLEAQPELAAETEIQKTLKSLPAAHAKIVTAVYNFTDKTGQHKPGETAQYSKAVTQGADAILKKALLDAANHQWFRVVERGGLDSLIQERKIISATRQTFAGDDKGMDPIGPLLYSGMLLEGGIISYDSNVVTGGAGARYLGIGGNSEYRRDVVTAYLSAVSVKTGEVLVSVSTAKTILSTSVSGGLYKFVSFDELLEAEAGFSVNEPPQFAVRQAIEMAVYALIMEGYEKDLWKFADRQAGTNAFLKYVKQRDGKVSESAKQKAIQLASLQQRQSGQRQFARTAPRNEPSAPQYSEAAPQYSQAQQAAPQVAQPQAPVSEINKRTVSASRLSHVRTVPASLTSQTPSQHSYQTAPQNSDNGHYLQVAVFPRAAASKSLVGKIAAAGYPVQVKQRRTGFGETYTVLVGPFSSEQEATQSFPELSKLVNETELH